MRKSFEERRTEYLIRIVNNDKIQESISLFLNAFRIPNMEKSDLLQILALPKSENELILSKKILNTVTYYFDQVEKEGNFVIDFSENIDKVYDYYEFGVQWILDEISEIDQKYQADNSLNIDEESSIFPAVFDDASNYARESGEENYFELCSNVNYVTFFCGDYLSKRIFREKISKLTSSNECLIDTIFDSIRYKHIIDNAIRCLTIRLFCKEKIGTEDSKSKPYTDEELEMASRYISYFDNYIKNMYSKCMKRD